MTALLAERKALDESSVLVRVRPLEVIEKFATPAHHAKEPTARVMVFHMRLEVLSQIGDARSEERNLDFGRTRVPLAPLVVLHQLLFLRIGYSHVGLNSTLKRRLFYSVRARFLKVS